MDLQDQAVPEFNDDSESNMLEHDLPEAEDHPDGEDADGNEHDAEASGNELDNGDDDIVIEGLEVAAPATAEHETPLIREMRAKLREEAKERKRLEREKQELERKIAPAPANEPIALGAKPTLESVGYDEEAYQNQLDAWYETKARLDAQKRQQEASQKAAQEEFSTIINAHRQKAASLKKVDYEEMADLVGSNLSAVQQEFILRGADDSAKLVYALGKYPAKLKELAAIKDPAKFAFAVAKLETQLKTQKRQTVQPEKVLSGGKGVVSSDKELDRLEAEAERTGDRTKVLAYKRKLKNQG